MNDVHYFPCIAQDDGDHDDNGRSEDGANNHKYHHSTNDAVIYIVKYDIIEHSAENAATIVQLQRKKQMT